MRQSEAVQQHPQGKTRYCSAGIVLSMIHMGDRSHNPLLSKSLTQPYAKKI
jgi:hypothetical protein